MWLRSQWNAGPNYGQGSSWLCVQVPYLYAQYKACDAVRNADSSAGMSVCDYAGAGYLALLPESGWLFTDRHILCSLSADPTSRAHCQRCLFAVAADLFSFAVGLHVHRE